MAFQCQDCSFKAAKRFPNGSCPACGSYNVKSTSRLETEPEGKPKKTATEILILVVVWGVLIWGVWDRYFN